MALPPWTIELLRRGLSDVARKAGEPETLERIKSQATEILQDLPQTAARGIDAVMRTAEAGKKSVQRWSRKHLALAVPIVNATGTLLEASTTGVPLPEEALEVGRELYAGDTSAGPVLESRMQAVVPGTGNRMAIATNLPAALTAVSLLIGERQLVVHRRHSVRLPDGTPLPEAFGLLAPAIEEVGSIDRVEPEDFQGLERSCVIMADGGEHAVELLDFVGQDIAQVVVLPVGSFRTTIHADLPSAEALLDAGADLVVLPGDGVCGGPECGIIVGSASLLESITSLDAWRGMQASDAVVAMMTLTLEASNSNETPISMLLGTSEENLQSRAERFAVRLGGSDQIAECRVTAEQACLSERGRWRFPSRQLRLRHASLSAPAWQSELQDEIPSIRCTTVNDELCIDLRWVPAASDRAMATALTGSDD